MPTLCALGGTAAAGHLQQRRGVHDELQPAAFSVEGALLSVVKKDDKLTLIICFCYTFSYIKYIIIYDVVQYSREYIQYNSCTHNGKLYRVWLPYNTSWL